MRLEIRTSGNFAGYVRSLAKEVREATMKGLEDAAAEIEKRGKFDIAGAGNFGRRWTEGLHADATQALTGHDMGITVSHDIPYFVTHEEGRHIYGRPLLWIPLSWTNAVGINARDYPDSLFRVDRVGKSPLLLSARTGEPLYSGHTDVFVPKRFSITEIARDVSLRLGEFIDKYIKRIKKR